MTRRPLDATTGLTRTRASMGDGTVRGKARIATPYDPRRLRTPTRAGTPGNEPVGETVSLFRASQVFLDSSSNPVEWTTILAVPVQAGWISVETPTDELQFPITAEWVVDLMFEWDDWAGGVTVEIWVGEVLTRLISYPFASRFDEHGISLGVCLRGERLQMKIRPSSGSRTAKNISCTVGLRETPVNLREPPGPWAWYIGDDLTALHSDGDPITTWPDRAGGAGPATPSEFGSGSPVPLYREALLNGLPGAEGTAVSNRSFDVYFVERLFDGLAWSMVIGGEGVGALDAAIEMLLDLVGNNIDLNARDGTQELTDNHGLTVGRPAVYLLGEEGLTEDFPGQGHWVGMSAGLSGYFLYVNGQLLASDSTIFTERLLDYLVFGQGGPDTHLMEVRIFDRELAGPGMQAEWNYMRERYAL